MKLWQSPGIIISISTVSSKQFPTDILQSTLQYQPFRSNRKSKLQRKRQFVGFDDDILDLIWIPQSSPPEDHDIATDTESLINPSPTESQAVEINYKLVTITNSSQIKIFNQDFEVELMDGHDDIVLAGDVTPDG